MTGSGMSRPIFAGPVTHFLLVPPSLDQLTEIVLYEHATLAGTPRWRTTAFPAVFP